MKILRKLKENGICATNSTDVYDIDVLSDLIVSGSAEIKKDVLDCALKAQKKGNKVVVIFDHDEAVVCECDILRNEGSELCEYSFEDFPGLELSEGFEYTVGDDGKVNYVMLKKGYPIVLGAIGDFHNIKADFFDVVIYPFVDRNFFTTLNIGFISDAWCVYEVE